MDATHLEHAEVLCRSEYCDVPGGVAGGGRWVKRSTVLGADSRKGGCGAGKEAGSTKMAAETTAGSGVVTVWGGPVQFRLPVRIRHSRMGFWWRNQASDGPEHSASREAGRSKMAAGAPDQAEAAA